MCKLSLLAAAAVAFSLGGGQAMAYTVDLYDTGASGLTSLASADALISSGPITVTAQTSIIEYDDLQDGSRGRFSINNAWPGSLNTTFAAHVYGMFYLATGGLWDIATNHDDGDRLSIDGNVVSTSDGVADNRESIASLTLSAGYHWVDIVYFENGGGASLEFYGRQGTDAFELIQGVPEPASLALVGLGMLGLGLGRRKPA